MKLNSAYRFPSDTESHPDRDFWNGKGGGVKLSDSLIMANKTTTRLT